MNKLLVPPPVSCGILLSYSCNSECLHCMYACSPKWKDDWISEEDIDRVLAQLSSRIKGGRFGTDFVDINSGLHLTGGEPFLNFRLLLKAVQMAVERRIPSLFAETDCFWAVNDEITREKLRQLRDAGLNAY